MRNPDTKHRSHLPIPTPGRRMRLRLIILAPEVAVVSELPEGVE